MVSINLFCKSTGVGAKLEVVRQNRALVEIVAKGNPAAKSSSC